MTRLFSNEALTSHVCEISRSNRRLMEKTLRMSCQSYEADIKAQLLTNTIHQIDDSRKILRKNRDDLQMILGMLKVGVMFTSSDGRVHFVNKSFQSLVGLEAQSLLGRQWEELLPLDRQTLETIRLSLLKADPEPHEIRVTCRCKDGKTRWIRLDVACDPRVPHRYIFFLYDYKVVHDRQEQLNRVRYGKMIGSSPVMQQLYDTLYRVARGEWTVLIEGETGTGKELVAHAIHAGSPRKKGPFIAVNCAALSESLLASQLFGHRRGAFTGAFSNQKGLFEAAEGGTLFLDEIGELSDGMQASLLRVLEQREITRLGETRPRKIDVRILAATHKNLASALTKGCFRSDLYFRLRTSQIRVPPLRERQADIPLLVAYFLSEARVSSVVAHEISVEAMDCLIYYNWPGNVRELKNAVEYILIHCQRTLVEPTDLPPEVRLGVGASSLAPSEPFDGTNAGDQRTCQLDALSQMGGNRTKAATLLGMSRATFYRRLSEFGVAGGP